MAQTTSHANACDIEILLDNAAGTPTSISGSSNRVGFTLNREVGELRTFQTEWPVRTSCGKSLEVTLGVIYTTASDEGKDIIFDWYFGGNAGTSRTLTLYVPTKNVGSDKISGEFALGPVSFDGDVSEPGPMAVECTLMSDGEITRSTAAT